MKALSIREPWASLIAEGIKTIELRSWKTTYRGPLLICASRGAPSREGRAAQRRFGIGTCAGHAIAIVDLVACTPAAREDAKAACCTVKEGEYAWRLENPRRIAPKPVTGRLGLFDVPNADFSTRTPSD